MSSVFLNDKPIFVENKDSAYNLSVLDGDFLNFDSSITTQKARGIFFLQRYMSTIKDRFLNWAVPKHLSFPAGTEFDDYCFNYPVFARPCPTVPRHGFVDSIVCKNGDELTTLSRETYNVEDQAEILITKPIDCYYNVIINGGVITFASGNDGATGGKGCHYFYISDDPISNVLNLESQNIIAENEVPFYELVLEKNLDKLKYPQTYLVQVRSAPSTPRVKDFVPAPVQVEQILKAEGDLLKWEKLLKEVDPKTTIVDHVNGSLSSHYAIHAIVNKVPIFTSYVPEIGSIIEPTVENSEIDEQDREKFYNAFVKGFCSTAQIMKNLKYNNSYDDNDKDNVAANMCKILKLSLATLHNFSSIAISKDYEILGLVLGLFSRVTFAVSAGESRYAHKDPVAMANFKEYFEALPFSAGRTPCYRHMIDRTPKDCINDAAIMYRIFNELVWGGSFGGKKWARCTKSAIELFNACIDKEINKVVELFNTVINEEHNGGKYLNKVINVSEFDDAANDPSGFTLNNLSTIVDWLHTSWNTQTEPVILSKISITIPITSKKTKMIENKLVKFKPLDANKFDKLLIQDKGILKEFTVPEPLFNSGPCLCEECTGDILIYSTPYWWVTQSGVKVISKSKLQKIINSISKGD